MPSSLQFVPRKVRKTVRAARTQGGTGAQEELPLPAQQSSNSIVAAPEQAEYPRDVLLRVRLIAELPRDEPNEAAAASNQRWRARLEGRIRRRLERACSHTVEYVDILSVSVVGAGASETETKVQVPVQGVRVECIVRCASPESAKRLFSSVTAANDKRRAENHGHGVDKHKSGGKLSAASEVEADEHAVSSQYIEVQPLQTHEQADYWSKVPMRIQRRASAKSGRSRSAHELNEDQVIIA